MTQTHEDKAREIYHATWRLGAENAEAKIQQIASALLAAEQRGIERAAKALELDIDWCRDEDGKPIKSWGRADSPFVVPAEGIPWDQIDRWQYALGLFVANRCVARIRALSPKAEG